MGGLSLTHWLIVLLVVAVIFGPSRLPQLGSGLGEAIRNFKRAFKDQDDETRPSEKKSDPGPKV
jgi:sec-independent protein translocase protein TatA